MEAGEEVQASNSLFLIGCTYSHIYWLFWLSRFLKQAFPEWLLGAESADENSSIGANKKCWYVEGQEACDMIGQP